ncbi:GNAT family N-acetyltransferase [Salimicrobium flavidum]|uniref:Protein N-acetyltransferase, RimJ/RimL family n=1 Tax=Salimicrobium flavidum TaxID=570947 RepID=A0A1N7JJZ3_9BACI|nr:GNAT family N-acetyltransferase [Salimicrobium flavidum]SIS49620.1 Protein N-acetyltransferase, RimJ/RimL family [Salimicrobium flavidum]
MNVSFEKLTEPSQATVDLINRWESDPAIIPLIRPNKNQEELDSRITVTQTGLKKQLEYKQIYLIFLDNQLVGIMDYMVNPDHLFHQIDNTAWLGILIGEREARGKGIGYQAINYIEEEVRRKGLKRIEIGVFEFNEQALKLYRSMGYKEIARIDNFTFWKQRMWADIRLEKYL